VDALAACSSASAGAFPRVRAPPFERLSCRSPNSSARTRQACLPILDCSTPPKRSSRSRARGGRRCAAQPDNDADRHLSADGAASLGRRAPIILGDRRAARPASTPPHHQTHRPRPRSLTRRTLRLLRPTTRTAQTLNHCQYPGCSATHELQPPPESPTSRGKPNSTPHPALPPATTACCPTTTSNQAHGDNPPFQDEAGRANSPPTKPQRTTYRIARDHEIEIVASLTPGRVQPTRRAHGSTTSSRWLVTVLHVLSGRRARVAISSSAYARCSGKRGDRRRRRRGSPAAPPAAGRRPRRRRRSARTPSGMYSIGV